MLVSITASSASSVASKSSTTSSSSMLLRDDKFRRKYYVSATRMGLALVALMLVGNNLRPQQQWQKRVIVGQHLSSSNADEELNRVDIVQVAPREKKEEDKEGTERKLIQYHQSNETRKANHWNSSSLTTATKRPPPENHRFYVATNTTISNHTLDDEGADKPKDGVNILKSHSYASSSSSSSSSNSSVYNLQQMDQNHSLSLIEVNIGKRRIENASSAKRQPQLGQNKTIHNNSTTKQMVTPFFFEIMDSTQLLNNDSLSSPSSCQPLTVPEEFRKKEKQQKERQLEFLHIPKTGGTAMESVAAIHNVSWGACHWIRRWKICPKIKEPRPQHKYWVPSWHLPIQYFDNDDFHPYHTTRSYNNTTGENPPPDVFVVVRNPYSRIVSEWNYMSMRGKYGDGTRYRRFKRQNKKHMNQYIQTALSQVYHAQKTQSQHKGGSPSRQTRTRPMIENSTIADYYFQREGHLIPQADYVVGLENGNNQQPTRQKQQQRKVIVLKSETLNDDFTCLMKRYNKLDWKLSPKGHIKPSQGQLSVADLTQESLQWIERVYELDFELFGYEKKQ